MIIGVFGHALGRPRRTCSARLRTSNATCVGFLIDSTTWLNLPTAAREEADLAHGTAALSLLRTGWRVVGVAHGDKLPALWPQAARGSQGFAWRATMAETVTTTTAEADSMNQRRHVTLVAAASTLLATAPLSTVFESWTWSVDVRTGGRRDLRRRPRYPRAARPGLGPVRWPCSARC